MVKEPLGTPWDPQELYDAEDARKFLKSYPVLFLLALVMLIIGQTLALLLWVFPRVAIEIFKLDYNNTLHFTLLVPLCVFAGGAFKDMLRCCKFASKAWKYYSPVFKFIGGICWYWFSMLLFLAFIPAAPLAVRLMRLNKTKLLADKLIS